ncbi:Putative NAD(P)H nitroreductase YdjA [Thalassovita gelatinovora]|uniref:Putative NAD(P)H nitroreductase n=1 Tax=Thalassovita gelatinovora TaxID=53501 RepID=A0A0P1FDH4_THAGE|nr:nitroreductase [Thalassovita gelatinovora]QIZ80604.1 nitroreductase [Thalassovita gelatinovora]CUH66152.1 Putative NAD(P)H nitroreductase YdjA [Thalassovita gelatinovora]SEQ77739.1 Nitroreductase [Thalassovita gelatinovora]
MPEKNPAALEFLLTRRSRPAKTLITPVPNRDELVPILTAAARTPDHGKLEPWRFIVMEKPALERLAGIARTRGDALELDPDRIAKGVDQFANGNLVVAVIEIIKPTDKVPALELTYSAGAVCLAMLNAALASGWGANWLSGWPSHDRGFMTDALGLAEDERVAGFIHIGTEKSAPSDRPRPDLENITQWLSE